MDVTRLENLPTPPGIIESIKSGFDAVSVRIWVILLPFFLNIFLWLGPRLRMEVLFKTLEADMVKVWQAMQIPAEEIQSMLDLYARLAQTTNLFGFLRSYPVGVSSLFSPYEAGFTTPLGVPAALQVTVFDFPLWLFMLAVLGWLGGALYFYSVARIALLDRMAKNNLFSVLGQTVIISIGFYFILGVLSVPVALIIGVAGQSAGWLGALVILFMALVSVWVIVPLFFWAHGIFVNAQNLFSAMQTSLQLTRFTLPTSSLFVITVFLLAYGLNFLWRIPARDTWVTIFGIFGHAFVTTALLAGSFIYYYNMSLWVRVVLERIRPNNNLKQA